jgi:hypothetical protein
MTNAKYNQLAERKELLENRIPQLQNVSADWKTQQTIASIIDESQKELSKIEELLTTKREYLYNFIGGGWNSEYAHTQEQAIAQAKERWLHAPDGLDVDEKTFRVSTPADYQNLLSLFY